MKAVLTRLKASLCSAVHVNVRFRLIRGLRGWAAAAVSGVNSDTRPIDDRRSVRFMGVGNSRMALTRSSPAETPAVEVIATQLHPKFGNCELILVEDDSVLAVSEHHLTNFFQVCREAVIEEKNVIDHLDTILHPLLCHVTAEAVSVTSGGKVHWFSAMRESAVRSYEGHDVSILLVKIQLPVPALSIRCCKETS